MLNPFDADGLQRLAARRPDRLRARSRAAHHARAEHGRAARQANIAGYKAVMIAADKYQRFFPMLMTAAGTVKAARVVILGVGVAGCRPSPPPSAWARSSRPATCARASRSRSSRWARKFIDVPYETAEEKEAAEGVGGYARPMPQSWLDAPEGRGRQARGGGRHRHQHRADPGPRRAGADHRRDGAGHEARLGDRRHGGAPTGAATAR